MTEHERELARALGAVSGWVGARFLNDISALERSKPEQELTLRQRHYMEILAWRYRRQLAAHLIPDAQPLPMPRKMQVPKKPRAEKKAQAALVEPDLFALQRSL